VEFLTNLKFASQSLSLSASLSLSFFLSLSLSPSPLLLLYESIYHIVAMHWDTKKIEELLNLLHLTVKVVSSV
jgi:hypothetical protein